MNPLISNLHFHCQSAKPFARRLGETSQAKRTAMRLAPDAYSFRISHQSSFRLDVAGQHEVVSRIALDDPYRGRGRQFAGELSAQYSAWL
jgi:hypothetical protein